MAKGLRLTLTATEARFVALALEDAPTPSTVPIAADIRRGLAAVEAKNREQRAKRAADREARRAEPVFRHFEVDGHRVSATQADWFDASRDPDSQRWERIRPEEPWRTIPVQVEHRSGWWMIHVWAPDRVAESIGEQLIEHLSNLDHAARAIIARVGEAEA